jgi:hypothetical protein
MPLKNVIVYEYVSREGNPWYARDAIINTDEITTAVELHKEGQYDDAKMMVTFNNGTSLRVKGHPQDLVK